MMFSQNCKNSTVITLLLVVDLRIVDYTVMFPCAVGNE
uniref:Uncharacterized protein n=1 Tax=Anguilla anguilla TaxID=7936 RepID=A0A0E9RZP3_ANGAN